MRQENTQRRLCDKTEPFSDNLEHLSALEYEANIRLALAYMRRSGGVFRGEERHVTETASADSPDLGFLKLDPERMNISNIEELLGNVEKENRTRAEASAEMGIELHFEKLVQNYHLDEFERTVLLLLFANNACMSFRNLFRQCKIGGWHSDGRMSIESVLRIVCPDQSEQIARRKNFSIEGKLIKNEIFLIFDSIENTTNILDINLFVHERIVRYILGDDNAYDMDFKCVTREESSIRMNQVILPDGLREDIERLVDNYSGSVEARKRLGIDEHYGYGTGLTLLFYGPSGTGKTMLARAIANRLGKTMLSLNLSERSQGNNRTFQDKVKHIFREARLSNGIVFFDECDDLFKNNSQESMCLLIEMEKAECITILATNKINELDPSLDRRVSKKVYFGIPDDAQRERIWRKMVPDNVRLAGDVDITRLARDYVFTGSLIRNTIQMAIAGALARDGAGNAVISHEEIETAAEDQAKRAFGAFEWYYTTHIPSKSIEDLLLPLGDREKLRGVVSVYRGGFEDMHLAIGSCDIEGGVEAVKGIAKGCGLVVREFSLIRTLLQKFDDYEDPLTQEYIVNLWDFVFRTGIGRRNITLLVDKDSFFEKCVEEHMKHRNKNFGYFLRKLEAFSGPVITLTDPLGNKTLPMGFDCYLELGHAPGEVRLKRWRELLGKELSDEEIAGLSAKFPLELDRIAIAVKRARMLSHLKGDRGRLHEETIREAVKSLKPSGNTPLLFGGN